MPAKILVIEDNPANLDLMIYILEAFHYETFSAMTGEEGMEMIQQCHPDLIICDIHLPGIDGYEVIRRLKADSDLRHIPVIAVTALAMVGEREKLLAAGFDGYISKPIHPEKFVQQMESFLKVHKRSTGATKSMEDSQANITIPPTKARILVVDNSPVNMQLIANTLEPFGYKVVSVTTVADALVYLDREELPDLILSDLHMPNETGYDFLSAVKKELRYHSIPFVVITSSVWGDKDRELCLNLGAAQFLLRPIEPESLIAEIRAVLNENSNRTEK